MAIDMGGQTVVVKPTASAGSSAPSPSDLDQFGNSVMQRLAQEGIPPLPIHYEVFFDKLLEEQPASFARAVTEQMELEEEGGVERSVALERKLKQGVATTKEILQNISKLYKSLATLQETITKRASEAKGLANPTAIATVTDQMLAEVQKSIDVLKNDSGQLKELYSKSLSIVKEAEDEAVYDSFYGLYNGRYFQTMVEREVGNVVRFRHASSILVVCLKESVADAIANEKKVLLVNRTIAKLLLKTSRRSDVIAHLGNGVFGMLVRHTDIDNAVRTAARISEMVSATNLFLEDREIDLRASIGVAPILEGYVGDDILSAAMGAMIEVERSVELSYKVGSFA